MTREPYFVTAQGLEKMRARLRAIKGVDRPQNVRDIEEARAHGDLSENAEFHAAKERQSFLETEMRDLESKIALAQVIDPLEVEGEKVVFGATVTLVNLDTDDEVTYQIVGEDEADIKSGTISYKSPLARAMIGKEEGDEIRVQAPGGRRLYEILGIEFR